MVITQRNGIFGLESKQCKTLFAESITSEKDESLLEMNGGLDKSPSAGFVLVPGTFA